MNAMILAAGRGERLRPYTDTCPKPMLEVRGKPLIEYHLEALGAAGISEVVINISWLAEQIEIHLGDGSRFGMKITYSHEPEALETAGGIVQALAYLNDRFIVINSDVFTDYPIKRLLEIESVAHLVLVENPAHHAAGDFTLAQGLIGNQIDNRYTFAGIAVYQKSLFTNLLPGKRALAPLLRQAADQQKVSGELYSGAWTDVGNLQRWQTIECSTKL
ncbi:MAG: nucleotidyltransferase family protein [Gammaproteobacteria bacterium]|nr:nucleotidyltransferase family protein [Gammaproteobacteria bacterium]